MAPWWLYMLSAGIAWGSSGLVYIIILSGASKMGPAQQSLQSCSTARNSPVWRLRRAGPGQDTLDNCNEEWRKIITKNCLLICVGVHQFSTKRLAPQRRLAEKPRASWVNFLCLLDSNFLGYIKVMFSNFSMQSEELKLTLFTTRDSWTSHLITGFGWNIKLQDMTKSQELATP